MMDDEELQRLYAWVDEIPLSRPKRNIARDFADGVLAAEVCHHYFPRLVDLHNYPPANSMQQKLYNWETLNSRVLRKLGAALPRADIEAVCQCAPGAVERVLNGRRAASSARVAGAARRASRRGARRGGRGFSHVKRTQAPAEDGALPGGPGAEEGRAAAAARGRAGGAVGAPAAARRARRGRRGAGARGGAGAVDRAPRRSPDGARRGARPMGASRRGRETLSQRMCAQN